MKKIYLIVFMLASITAFAQETEKKEVKSCEVPNGFQEPERDKKTKKWAKKMNKFNEGAFPSLEDVKNHVAIDNDCNISEVTLLRLSEQAGNGIYVYCVKGRQIKYKRIGTVIMIEKKNSYNDN